MTNHLFLLHSYRPLTHGKFFVLAMAVSFGLCSYTAADSPCAWHHSEIMVNRGAFLTDQGKLYFQGLWDSRVQCSFVWDDEALEFRPCKIPENAVQTNPPPPPEELKFHLLTHFKISIDIQRNQVTRNLDTYALKGIFTDEVKSLLAAKKVEFDYQGNPLKVYMGQTGITIISREHDFNEDDWAIAFFESTKECVILNIGFGDLSAACSDATSLYLGFTQYDEVEGCESFGSPGILSYNVNENVSQLCRAEQDKLLGNGVLHMTVWNRRIFAATRRGICVSDGKTNWLEYRVRASIKKNAQFQPHYFLASKDKLDSVIYRSETVVTDERKLSQAAKILRTANSIDNPLSFLYCVNEPMSLYWRFDPESSSAENYILHYAASRKYLQIDMWYQTTFFGGCEPSSPAYPICWRYESSDAYEIELEYLGAGCYKATIPFCWVPSDNFDVRLERQR